MRLFPGTSAESGTTTWVVRAEGCSRPGDNITDCVSSRGFLFNPNASSTWTTAGLKNSGLYNLNAYVENLLGYRGNAYYGFDNVTLGWPSHTLPEVSHQIIAGYATEDFYIGSLGISPQPQLFGDSNHAFPSLLTTLRNQSLIPSTSWGYTAGAYYQQPSIYGSLTLGGYDTTRFVSNNVSFTFAADSSRDLLVGVQQITSDNLDTPLLSTGIYAFIDSMVPHIWLPTSVCTAFEKAFNLTWNDTVSLYLLTDDEHANLVAMNANITVRLGPNAAGNESVDIVIPYGAFDLIASSPLVESPTHYFPLQRAQNASQYTFGRVFLQQAYVIADYDRSNFSVSQALFPATSIKKSIVATLPPGAALDQKQHALSKKAIAAISCSISVLLILLLAIIYYFRRRRRLRSPKPPVKPEEDREENQESIVPFEKAELDHTSTQIAQLETPPTPELDTTELVELSSDLPRQREAREENRLTRQEPDPLYLTNRRQEVAGSAFPDYRIEAEPNSADKK